MPDWFLRVTVPGDPAFVETIADLTRAVVDLVPCEAACARDACLAVQRASAHAIETSGGDERGVEVRFERRNDLLEIDVRFADHAGTAGPGAGTQGCLDQISPLMDGVEFARERDLAVCRMLRQLPRAPAE